MHILLNAPEVGTIRAFLFLPHRIMEAVNSV